MAVGGLKQGGMERKKWGRERTRTRKSKVVDGTTALPCRRHGNSGNPGQHKNISKCLRPSFHLVGGIMIT